SSHLQLSVPANGFCTYGNCGLNGTSLALTPVLYVSTSIKSCDTGFTPSKSSYHKPIAANATPLTACNSISVTSSSSRLPLGNPSILGMVSRLAVVLKRGSVKPNAAALTIPSVLKSGEFLGVGGTAIFRRSISPRVG